MHAAACTHTHTWLPPVVTVPTPLQVQALAVYCDITVDVSDSVYVPASTVTAVPLVVPETTVVSGAGPTAVSVKSCGAALPPLLLTTTLMSVNFAGLSLLVMVHTAFVPSTTVT
jgi:hypothetical protein